ncbi:transposase domain-containing protein [Komagataeibacter oboediens]|uniref:Transposase n=1 Tax=Komagataeibacter oboediens TaxID=65958 RepID=A0ABS5SRY9_9PROT|nr:transposase domain-containing protein [Komagataeibacter oboediens]MBL7232085.1 Mu transposase C-terminal domain-containing protein [Komagataeibacter oboediens]MBT0676630.1 transposase [Komagataeibacter oboediens]MBT0679933.1 transposase [Komagataeibacter oboediens]
MHASAWLSPAELAAMALPGLPGTKQGIQARIEAENWLDPEREGQTWRKRAGRGGGYEFTMYALPLPTQAALAIRLQDTPIGQQESEDFRTECRREDLWRRYEAMPETRKEAARKALAVIEAIETLLQAGVRKNHAIMQVARLKGVGKTTIYNWYRDIRGLDRCDWLPALAPHYAASQARAECPAEAWEILKADYLRLSGPTFQDCYRRLEGQAKKNGWTLPSAKTLKRRMDALGTELLTLCRKGEEALTRMYPAQERDRSLFHALEAVNADGHTFDVFVQWPGVAKPVRPTMIGFQDLYSGMILSWRLDISENKEMVRLAFGDMVERYGIPHHCWLDNGRSFASKWLTGGVENRYRFKLRDDEPQGIMPHLGVQVHWTNPYSGQSKPIERAWRDLAQGLSKHPRFEGAYTGNNPVNKPENYGTHAVPLDEFIAIVAEGIREHNERIGRRSKVCGGKHSFRQAFEASYAAAPITKATPEQRRMWLMAAEAIRADRRTGAITLEGNRYWAECLAGMGGEQLIVRFDPQAMHQSVHVYRLDNTYVAEAQCLEAAGFADKTAAQSHNRARKAWVRAQKDMAKAQKRMSVGELQDIYLPDPNTAGDEPVEAKIVRPFRPAAIAHGNAAVAIDLDAIEDGEEEELSSVVKLRQFMRQQA